MSVQVDAVTLVVLLIFLTGVNVYCWGIAIRKFRNADRNMEEARQMQERIREREARRP